MNPVEQIVPAAPAPIELEPLLHQLTDPASRLAPFSDAVLNFCMDLSNALFRDPEARRYPELQALAFWMRKSELLRMKKEFESLSTDCTFLVPRGLVFHLPPSNVDTIFMYSWIVSVLAGNANIIRMSERAAGAASLICRLFNAALEKADPAVRSNTAVVRYGHDRAITANISALADVRVIWGGDATVETVRSIPVPPHAKELTFPDRYSLAVINAQSYLNADEPAWQELASNFYNDCYWFDQMACSSPRFLIWTGNRAACESASGIFLDRLEKQIAAKHYTLAAGPKLNKLTFAYRAVLDQLVVTLSAVGPECTVLQLESVSGIDRNHCGGGLLFQAWTNQLASVAGIITRRDQTLTHYGFSSAELRSLATALNGRGIDRIVPVGQALSFHRFWDGYDLLREFTRIVYVQV